MNRPSLTVTLKELIDSGRYFLSDCAFSIEGSGDECPDHVVDDNGSRSSRSSSRKIANAVKVSLMLARAFARRHSREGGGDALSSVRLEHVHVQLSSRDLTQGDHDAISALLFAGRSEYDAVGIEVSSREWALAGVEIMHPCAMFHRRGGHAKNNNAEPTGTTAEIRRLGELIYALLSGEGKLPLPVRGSNESFRSNESGSDESRAHSLAELRDSRSKKKRVQEVDSSFFASLVESGEYPISMCRLLSDMIDTGVGGRSKVPFETVDEVVADLERMLSFPNIFLDDADDFELAFGQRHYGQTEEISHLLAATSALEQNAKSNDDASRRPDRVEVVFVTGVAGQGKTHLVTRVGEFLSGLGCWVVARTKFERGAEHDSRKCISSLFDDLVAGIAALRGGNEADAEYCRRAASAVSNAIDPSSLPVLATFVPSIGDLIPGAGVESAATMEGELKSWQLTFLLTKLMSALLSLDRFIMMCLDDLQWCDSTMLALMSEIMVHSGERNRAQRCIYIATFRSNEVSGEHPVMAHYNDLQAKRQVNVTDIKLSSLSQSAVLEMVMTEMRLPRRLVVELADVVYKKTVGHALFVSELLQSLVRDGNIYYSPRSHCYVYDRKSLLSIKPCESVAGLIVSNLSSLPSTDLHNLRILGCLGMQINLSTIHLLEGCPGLKAEALSQSLNRLANDGIIEIERDGHTVKFSHDLIHEQVVESLPVEDRHRVQFEIGIFLGSLSTLDKAIDEFPSTELTQLNDDGKEDETTVLASSLALIAVDMINCVGPPFVNNKFKGSDDPPQRTRFARWNLVAALESKARSNFRSALHYCKKGIDFLGDDLWSSKLLGRELHEKASYASYAIGHIDDCKKYAETVVQNVAFEESLFAQLMILKCLESAEEHEHTIARGVALLRTLNFSIPPSPTPLIVMETLIQTAEVASRYSIEQIIQMQKATVVDSEPCVNSAHVGDRNILNLVEAVSMACYQTASPYYPLVTCAIVNYSLEHGICVESATAFSVLGYFKIFFEGDYESGKYWAHVAEKILENSSRTNGRALLTLDGFLHIWVKPLKALANRLLSLYEISMKTGAIDNAMYAICQYWRFAFYGGENLAILALSFDKFMRLMVCQMRDAKTSALSPHSCLTHVDFSCSQIGQIWLWSCQVFCSGRISYFRTYR
ncbi:hypothetical protein ACHAWF_018684 [Thalassiosira exigua]